MSRPPVLLRAPCPSCGSPAGAFCLSATGTKVLAGHKARRDAAALLPPVALRVTTRAGVSLYLIARLEDRVKARAPGSERQLKLTLDLLSEESQVLVSTLPIGWTAKAARALATEGA